MTMTHTKAIYTTVNGIVLGLLLIGLLVIQGPRVIGR
jgi:hypothetical protein